MPLQEPAFTKLMSSHTPSGDPVNHPAHYTQGGIECIDLLQQNLTEEQFIGYLAGNHQKYVFRWQSKGGVTDLLKARWYLNRLLDELRGHSDED